MQKKQSMFPTSGSRVFMKKPIRYKELAAKLMQDGPN